MFTGGAGQVAAGIEGHGAGIDRCSGTILGIHLPLVFVSLHEIGIDVMCIAQ
ncbi:hypothetical protein D3C72_2132850 [compost metagenome]